MGCCASSSPAANNSGDPQQKPVDPETLVRSLGHRPEEPIDDLDLDPAVQGIAVPVAEKTRTPDKFGSSFWVNPFIVKASFQNYRRRIALKRNILGSS